MPTIQKIYLKDVMVKKPKTIYVKEPFSEVWKIFQSYGFRHLPVVDRDGKLCGIITSRDLFRIIPPHKTMEGEIVYETEELDHFILEQVMSKDVFALSPDDTLGKAIELMVRFKYGCIPVIDNVRNVVGIVTNADILKALSLYFM